MAPLVSTCKQCRNPVVRNRYMRLHIDAGGDVSLRLKLNDWEIEELADEWVHHYWFIRWHYECVGGGSSDVRERMFYFDQIKEIERVLGSVKVQTMLDNARECVQSQFPDGDAFMIEAPAATENSPPSDSVVDAEPLPF